MSWVRVKDAALRNWLALAIGAVVWLAWCVPGAAARLIDLGLIDVGVVAIMFLGAVKLSPTQFREAARHPGTIAFSVISVFGVAPVISLAVAWLMGFRDPSDRLAVLLCSTQASTLATAIVLTEVAGGHVATAMVVTVASNALSALLTPLGFALLGGGAEIEVNSLSMAGELALKIVLPVAVAQIVRPRIAAWTKRRSRAISISCQLIILVIVYTGVVSGLANLSGGAEVLLKVLLMAAVLHTTLLIFNALIFNMASESPDRRAALVLSSSQKTLPAGILIWKSQLSALPLGPLVVVSYHLVQLVLDSTLAPSLTGLPLIRSARPHVKGTRR